MSTRDNQGHRPNIVCARISGTLALLLTFMSSASSAQPDTGSHLWRNRLLLIEAPSIADPDFQRQSALLLVAFPGLLERDLIVKTSLNADTFALRLIGKDGSEKLLSPSPVEAEEIFSLIDSMPMRQAEMQRRAALQ